MADEMHVRPGTSADADDVARQFLALWPDGSLDEHRTEAEAILSGTPPSTLPPVVLVAEQDTKVVGFVEVGLRSRADGCDGRHPVGFVEGWFVAPEHRGEGVGRSTTSDASEHHQEHHLSETFWDVRMRSSALSIRKN